MPAGTATRCRKLGVVIVLISGAVGVVLTNPGPIEWVYYTPAKFAAAKDNGSVVVMEFTACFV